MDNYFMNTFSTFWFARPSFIEGCARVLDIGNTLQEYNRPTTDQEADFRAIASDWQAVGVDLQAAMNAAIAQRGLQSVQKLKKADQKK